MPSQTWYKKPWVAILAVLVIGAGIGLVVSNVLRDDADAADTTTAPSTSTATGSAAPDQDGVVDGCLGGPDLEVALIDAQQNAPLTNEGLAALARTTMRWLLHYPVPANAEATLQQLTGDPELAADMLADITTKAQELEASGYTSAEVDLTKGGYRLGSRDVEGDENELAEVDLLVYRVTERAGQTTEQRMVIGVGFKIHDGLFTYGLQDPEPAADRPDSEFTAYDGAC